MGLLQTNLVPVDFMTMFRLKGFENRNPVSNTKKAVAFLRLI